MTFPVLIALLAAAAQAPAAPAEGTTVEDLGGNRFRITISHRGVDQRRIVAGIAEMQAAAVRACRGRGDPVATSAAQFGAYPNERWAMSRTFACEAPSGQ